MNIDKITSMILEEAQEAKKVILAEAKAKNDAVLQEAEEKAAMLLSKSKEMADEEKERLVSRRKSVAEIDCRKVLLAKKQELIQQCFEQAKDQIIGMEESKYIQLLVQLGKASGCKEGQLIFNEKEKIAIGGKVAEGLNQQIPGGNFQVAEETRKLKGGYMMVVGQMCINNTIEALVEEYQDHLTGEIAEKLFSEEA